MTDGPSENRAVGTRLKDLLLQKQAPAAFRPESSGPQPENADALALRVQALETENRALAAELERQTEKADAMEARQARQAADAFSQAVAALKLDRFLDALGWLRAVLILDPDHPRARINLAVAWAALDHEDRAVAELERVLVQDPENETARKNLAILKPQAGTP